MSEPTARERAEQSISGIECLACDTCSALVVEIILAAEQVAEARGRAAGQEERDNAVMFIIRLTRQMARDNPVRLKALDWLAREGLMPDVLRDKSAIPTDTGGHDA